MNDKKYINNFNHQSYEVRSKNYKNISEDRFEHYCIDRGYCFTKLSLNSVASSQSFADSVIPMFSKLPLIYKSQADYFIYKSKEEHEKSDNKEKCQWFVELKNATYEHGKTLAKIKVRDLKRYIYFEQGYTNQYTRFTICFPLNDKIIFKSVDQILKALPKAELKKFPNDNIEYFEIQLS
jgi:hypothetical protein